MISMVSSLAGAAIGNTSFVTIGDWGGAGLGGYHEDTVYKVAKQIGKTAADNNAKFVINTGDNFYYCGIENTSDPLVEIDFVKPYTDQSLQVAWYGVLGNHEYGYSVEAQLELTKKLPNWVMPERYYTKRLLLDDAGSHYASFIFIDTSPCIKAYRTHDSTGWDPCGGAYPTCSPSTATCHFHENILSQSCTDQADWFKSALAAVPADDWLIVVGHHPADEIDDQDLTSMMQEHGFDLYLNGHAHTLTQYSVDGNPAYVTSGAGAMVDTGDQEAAATKLKLHGGNRTVAVSPSGEVHAAAKAGRSSNSSATSEYHHYETVWNLKTAGFTLHTFSPEFVSLRTDYVDYTGAVIHSFTVHKRDRVVGKGKGQQQQQKQKQQIVEQQP